MNNTLEGVISTPHGRVVLHGEFVERPRPISERERRRLHPRAQRERYPEWRPRARDEGDSSPRDGL